MSPAKKPLAGKTMTSESDIWEREVFSRKYVVETSDWAGHSGSGSSAYHTIKYKAFLETFILENGVKSILDIGCGDWQFARFVNFGPGVYFGYDVVGDVVQRNLETFGSASRIFRMMPNNLAELPACDLLIMKDVLQHLSNAKISRFVTDLFPRARFCLITNSYEKLNTPQNIDVFDGEFRCLDLTAPPYRVDGAYVCEIGSSLWERIRTLLIVNLTKR